MFGLTRKNSPLLGIDISTTAIKLIELSRTATTPVPRFRVEHYAVEPLPGTAIVEKRIVEHEVVGDGIRRALARSGAKTKRAAVALAGAAVITKVINLPAALKDAEMESQIQLDADQYIPYPLEEVNLDFSVLGPSPSDPALVEVLLAASRRENVDDRISVLEIAGLTPLVVDVEAYAMEHACSMFLDGKGDGKEAPILGVVDVGASTTTLHVFSEGRIMYTREQNFGGRQLRDEVQRRYGLTDEQSAQKIRDGDVADTYEIEVLNPFKEALAQQIGRALQFFYSGTTFSRVDRILLAGGSAGIPGVDALVEERLRIPATVANPFSQMSFAPRVNSKSLMREAPGMMVAVGLALRGFD
ncbi:pilus assembly protein PilM [Allochromatium humboldtianum]|uniref:Pilus assembly protein PilM n=1 Tax=Allochromatium humboldtianum TaxID=504901 RepID=A0A850RL37_9GAMM|nr:pilus assembly protein PilM [Allochromatium humboldtianum]NVZ10211.1 pilus assembly protein PilM [Allochromatium humboldtianum]